MCLWCLMPLITKSSWAACYLSYFFSTKTSSFSLVPHHQPPASRFCCVFVCLFAHQPHSPRLLVFSWLEFSPFLAFMVISTSLFLILLSLPSLLVSFILFSHGVTFLSTFNFRKQVKCSFLSFHRVTALLFLNQHIALFLYHHPVQCRWFSCLYP